LDVFKKFLHFQVIPTVKKCLTRQNQMQYLWQLQQHGCFILKKVHRKSVKGH
jgi:hypothetical protein